MGVINIDIGATKRRAAQISDLSVTVKNLSNSKMNGVYTALLSDRCWSGEGADRYRKKLNKINQRIKKRGENLKSISNGLMASARNLEKIESYAKSLFQ